MNVSSLSSKLEEEFKGLVGEDGIDTQFLDALSRAIINEIKASEVSFESVSSVLDGKKRPCSGSLEKGKIK